jgi:hypothetical protein
LAADSLERGNTGAMASLNYTLSKLTREDLTIVARKLKIRGIRKLPKDSLIDAILQEEPSKIKRSLQITWWDRHKHGVFGWASIFGFLVGLYALLLSLNSQPFSQKVEVRTSEKHKLVCFLDIVRFADKDDWLSVAPSKLIGILSNTSDSAASEVIATVAVGPGQGTIKNVAVYGDVSHTTSDRASLDESVWLKTIRFPHFPPHAEVTIVVEALATEEPPGFPRITTITSAESGPATLITKRYDPNTKEVRWEAFTGGTFILDKSQSGKEGIIWTMVRWESDTKIDPRIQMEALKLLMEANK